jgi:hypothetical protein
VRCASAPKGTASGAPDGSPRRKIGSVRSRRLADIADRDGDVAVGASGHFLPTRRTARTAATRAEGSFISCVAWDVVMCEGKARRKYAPVACLTMRRRRAPAVISLRLQANTTKISEEFTQRRPPERITEPSSPALILFLQRAGRRAAMGAANRASEAAELPPFP